MNSAYVKPRLTKRVPDGCQLRCNSGVVGVKFTELSPTFRWQHRGRCSTYWKQLPLGLKIADGMEVSCSVPEGGRRYRVRISDQMFTLHDERTDELLIEAERGSRPRAKLFGWFPLPAIRTWTFSLPGFEQPFVIVETWRVTFEIGDQVLNEVELPVRYGVLHTFNHFECHVRPWASLRNTDADFSWEQEQWLLPAAIATAYLQHRLHEKTAGSG